MSGDAPGKGRPMLPARRDPDVTRIVRRWRELTSGRGAGGRLGPGELTLVGCSGGADSSALVLALAAATRRIVVAHVVHDMRPEIESLADRDAVRELASVLGLPFVEARVGVSGRTVDGVQMPALEGERNPEAVARRLRYLALERLARGAGARFIATAHHAGDQLESMLMALARGAGPAGLRGVAASRPVRRGSEVRLIRPMLVVDRAACERLCRECAWAWRDDVTNADTTRLRAFLRHRIVPELRVVRPGIERRAASAAELLADATSLLHDRALVLLGDEQSGGYVVSRASLRAERAGVVGEVLRRAAARLAPGGRTVGGRARTDQIVACIRSAKPHARVCTLGVLRVEVGAREVRLTRITPPPDMASEASERMSF